MLVGDLNLNPLIKESTPALFLNMETDPQAIKLEAEQQLHDVEEGEISDSASVEEISEEDFNIKQPSPQPPPKFAVNPSNVSNNTSGGSGARVLTVRDMYKYQISPKTSYSGLYNLAWAQAVNNKPLGDVFVMMEDGSTDNSNSDSNRVVIDVEDDDEKEEGELEEGEIDLDSEVIVQDKDLDVVEIIKEDKSKGVDLIMEELVSLNATDAQNSFDAFCSRLEATTIKLHKIVLEGPFAEKDTLLQLLLAAIQTLHSVFSSMTPSLKQQKEAILLRLLAQVTSLKPLFSSLQLKEVEAIRLSLESSDISLSNGATAKTQGREGFNTTDLHVLLENADNKSDYLWKHGKEPGSAGSVDQSGQSFPIHYSKPGIVNLRLKGMPPPLLDLHKDHDADSLPSPTREHSATSPFDKGLILEQGLLKPEWPVPRQTLPQANPVLHPYETDAVKAVSSYQQKFGHGSFFVDDRLPSPTPSGEGDNNGDGEACEEVSSSVSHNFNPAVNSLMLGQPTFSSTASRDAIAGPEISNVQIVNTVNSFRTPVSKPSSVRSRDPRLRMTNSDAGPRNVSQSLPSIGSDESKSTFVGVMSLRKHKVVEELPLDSPTPKRQKNESLGPDTTLPFATTISTSQMPTPSPSLPVNSHTKSPLTSQTEIFPAKSSSASSPLHSLLRDIVGNPAMWMSILKMEHKSSGDNNSASQIPNPNSILGAAPSTSGALPFSSMLGQKPAGIVPCQPVTVEEPGKVRMKPRDPRRILHNNAPQKIVTAVSDPPKKYPSSSSVMMSNLSTQGQEGQMEKAVPSGSVKPPDITMQFTNNLRNIADIMSVSQASTPSPVLPLSVSSQPLQSHQAALESKIVATEAVNFRSGSNSTSDTATSIPPRPLNANAWSDVEHLFDGFDNQQKAAIQRERARRLEEQNKMFSARKLCLVLDLDHTLLNSAKFVEVDPLHDEMLRKKEEQDREKSQRHLFRFPYMGMWTKLRPGIWNFLEKASKLYELHLYTMGNKYYATEMAKLLDPKGELFSGRVISRGDDGEPFDSDDRVPKSKDLEGVLGMESSVVIIDDSVRVWPHNKPNLIVVERYIYFPCSRRQFGLPGPSLLEIDHDERPEDGTLASSLAVIEKIHQIFFGHDSLDEADVRQILASEQRKILAGCRIVFSRVFPVGEAHPQMHPLWKSAEQFGAECTTHLDEQVTHVVANSLGTDKVNWALSRGIFVVHPGWVEASTLLYRRANEHDFAIKQ
ncbi:RNA polymerase II C-terminal domain phosphatase-like 3 [Salvia hispanica]|uniref:RNA polymerase II C-terminal domain phosphatase-like 3 n=1 Tax=Salvia hispanica TaxID=49212 RepID=UPI0020090555|nr:RNA polymerase II C-terminal domain phosphatase-like 3 [Salvia hispanica]